MALFKIQPEFVTRLWGWKELSPWFDAPEDTKGPIGEVWLSGLGCRVEAVGDSAGEKSLEALWNQLSPEEKGSNLVTAGRFPFLVKFLFTEEKLSLQVHPDDDFARRKEGEPWGKSEVWHVLSAEPDAWVKVGFRQGVPAEDVAARWGKPEIEGALQHIRVKAGDTVYVPAGTVHSIGPGLCLCEIQSYSDITYRIYDYGRKGLEGRQRELHLESAREALHFQTESAGLVLPEKIGDDSSGGMRLVSCRWFTVEKFRAESAGEVETSPASAALYVCIVGSGQIHAEGGEHGYRTGTTFLATANAGTVSLVPDERTTFLRVSRRTG